MGLGRCDILLDPQTVRYYITGDLYRQQTVVLDEPIKEKLTEYAGRHDKVFYSMTTPGHTSLKQFRKP